MLYLEDYVELIEHLPVDLRDRFTDMREMDLQVQNTVDEINSKVKELFKACAARKGKVENADEMFNEIRETYYKALEDADEKVQFANQIYDLVDRHLRKLDQELAKFKMELEADNAGITEILERRSLDLDNHASHGASGNLHKRKHASASALVAAAAASSQGSVSSTTLNGGLLEKKIKSELPDSAPFQCDSAPPSVYRAQDSSAPPSGNDSDVGNSRPSSRNSVAAGCGIQPSISALQLAAVQAVQATAEMQVGRRTSSLKASYEAYKEFPVKVQPPDENQHIALSTHDISQNQSMVADELIDEDSSHSHTDGLIMSPGGKGTRPSRTKKQTSKAAAWNQERMQAEARRGHARDKDQNTSISPNTSVVEMVGEGASTTGEWSCDPNEPRYCMCNQVSYGEMVGCDNEKCTIEWFHYGCVGLTEAPKGKWYCPQCMQTMKRRNRNR